MIALKVLVSPWDSETAATICFLDGPSVALHNLRTFLLSFFSKKYIF